MDFVDIKGVVSEAGAVTRPGRGHDAHLVAAAIVDFAVVDRRAPSAVLVERVAGWACAEARARARARAELFTTPVGCFAIVDRVARNPIKVKGVAEIARAVILVWRVVVAIVLAESVANKAHVVGAVRSVVCWRVKGWETRARVLGSWRDGAYALRVGAADIEAVMRGAD